MRRALPTVWLPLALFFAACNAHHDADPSAGKRAEDSGPMRFAGVRDFPHLIAQLSSALSVRTDDPNLHALLVARFGVPPRIVATPPAPSEPEDAYRARTFDFLQPMLYQRSDQRRSTAVEANRLRLVGAFCDVAVRTAGTPGATDLQKGLFRGIDLTTMTRIDVDKFLAAAGPVFRRSGPIPQAETDVIAGTMANVAIAAGATQGWIAGCVLVAGESEAGEL